VVVEETPSPEQLKRSGLRRGDLLLGLYEGVPRGGRGPYYTLVLPDKISIFKNSIETIAQTPLAIKFQVRKTVRHEIAHHFGFSDEQLRD
jgi:predicted Zn-dependent protease with MMP-like domain